MKNWPLMFQYKYNTVNSKGADMSLPIPVLVLFMYTWQVLGTAFFRYMLYQLQIEKLSPFVYHSPLS